MTSRTFAGDDGGLQVLPKGWETFVVARVEELMQEHRSARLQLERELDVCPTEPHYSEKLTHLMKTEEQVLSGVFVDKEKVKQLGRRINALLKKELKKLFATIRVYRERRWKSLVTKQKGEWRELENMTGEQLRCAVRSMLDYARGIEASGGLTVQLRGYLNVLARFRKMDDDFQPKPEHCYSVRSFFSSESNDQSSFALSGCDGSDGYSSLKSIGEDRQSQGRDTGTLQPRTRTPSPTPTRPSSPSYEMLRREMEVRKNTALNYARAEAIHIDVAFAHQRARVETEWKEYLQQMQEEYETRLARFEDREARPVARSRSPSPLSSSWQSNEKQSQLIHTAPVLSPKIQETADTLVESSGDFSSDDAMVEEAVGFASGGGGGREAGVRGKKPNRKVRGHQNAASSIAERKRQSQISSLLARYNADVKSVSIR